MESAVALSRIRKKVFAHRLTGSWTKLSRLAQATSETSSLPVGSWSRVHGWVTSLTSHRLCCWGRSVRRGCVCPERRAKSLSRSESKSGGQEIQGFSSWDVSLVGKGASVSARKLDCGCCCQSLVDLYHAHHHHLKNVSRCRLFGSSSSSSIVSIVGHPPPHPHHQSVPAVSIEKHQPPFTRLSSLQALPTHTHTYISCILHKVGAFADVSIRNIVADTIASRKAGTDIWDGHHAYLIEEAMIAWIRWTRASTQR